MDIQERERFIGLYLAGEITDEDKAVLEKAALKDEALARQLANCTMVERLLKLEFGASSAKTFGSETQLLIKSRRGDKRFSSELISRIKQDRVRSAKLLTSRFWKVCAASLLVLVGATLFNRLQQGPPLQATVISAESNVPIVRGDNTIEIVEDMPLQVNDEINMSGRVKIRYDDTVAILDFKKETRIEFLPGRHIFLHKGQLKANISTQSVNSPFIFSTQSSSVEVLGTEFVYSTSPNS